MRPLWRAGRVLEGPREGWEGSGGPANELGVVLSYSRRTSSAPESLTVSQEWFEALRVPRSGPEALLVGREWSRGSPVGLE